jgi:uncharacterized protein (DUF433 family)
LEGEFRGLAKLALALLGTSQEASGSILWARKNRAIVTLSGKEGPVTEDPTVMSAFTVDHVVRLTGLTARQLAYWDRTGFFRPHYASENRRSPFGRIYSFKDVVGLRILSILRGEHGVPLPHLREIAKRLAANSKNPWSNIRLKVWNRNVEFDEPGIAKTGAVVDSQYVLLPVVAVIEDVKRGAEKLKRREPSQIGKIEKHRYVSHNAPVVAGTRIRVATILRFLEDGFAPAEIVKEYPSLTEADVAAVIRQGKASLAA